MDFLPVQIEGARVYAGFMKRQAAFLIDGLVLVLFLYLSQKLQGFTIPTTILVMAVFWALYPFYSVYFNFRYGGTLGKLAVKIRVTRPDGSKIGLREAFLRSVVDIGFAVLAITAEILAISQVDADQYLVVGMLERAQLLLPLYPAWKAYVNDGSSAWVWSELLVILLNERKRALHDFIAGTVVIHREYAKLGDSR
ncbi:MAG: RDD family protein [Candidatus Marinimicrobia bacterium]|nr:RDD family protein [Candidatus Neomarinimicrobiota bacterium]